MLQNTKGQILTENMGGYMNVIKAENGKYFLGVTDGEYMTHTEYDSLEIPEDIAVLLISYFNSELSIEKEIIETDETI